MTTLLAPLHTDMYIHLPMMLARPQPRIALATSNCSAAEPGPAVFVGAPVPSPHGRRPLHHPLDSSANAC